MKDEVVLYSYRRCPFAIRARVTLNEKGIAHRIVEEDLGAMSDELLRLHPEGRVPLLVHRRAGDTRELVVYESAIITEYLDEAFAGPKLMPAEAAARAEVRLWTYWCNHLFKPDLDAYKYELAGLAAPARDELLARLDSHLRKWDDALAATGFLVGAGLTLADLHLFPFYRQLSRVPPRALELSAYPRLNDWLERMMARPSFVKAMEKPAPAGV